METKRFTAGDKVYIQRHIRVIDEQGHIVDESADCVVHSVVREIRPFEDEPIFFYELDDGRIYENVDLSIEKNVCSI